MNVFNLIAGAGGPSEGLYIWKKYELQKVVNTNITGEFYWQKTASNKTVTWYMSNTYTEENGQFVLDNPTTYAQSYGGYTTSGAQYLIADSSRGTKMAILPAGGWIYNTANGVYVSTGGPNKQMNTYSYENVFIDYVISDKEDAYPDGAEQGGFYYERFEPIGCEAFGFTKYVAGEITLTTADTKAIITHNMGVKPLYGMIYGADGSTNILNNITTLFSGDELLYNIEFYSNNTSGSLSTISARQGVTTTSFKFESGSGKYFKAGLVYKYILMA